MRRVLLVARDKQHAVRLRNLLEELELEFEIAIGEEIGKGILSERYMDAVLVDASMIRSENFWLFSFLLNRRLPIPVVILGGEGRDIPLPEGAEEQLRIYTAPIDPQRLETVLACAKV